MARQRSFSWMSFVRSIVPPPVQVPASIANGCTLGRRCGRDLIGIRRLDVSLRDALHCIWAAAGTKADASTKAAAPQISFNVMALTPY